MPSTGGGMGDAQVGSVAYAHEEVDAVLAAAYLPMEPIEVRFARCEALAAHGYIPQVSHTHSSSEDVSRSSGIVPRHLQVDAISACCSI